MSGVRARGAPKGGGSLVRRSRRRARVVLHLPLSRRAHPPARAGDGGARGPAAAAPPPRAAAIGVGEALRCN